MEAVVEQIIKKRAYGTLSAEERSLISEWCGTEEEFTQMKRFLSDVEGLAVSGRMDPQIDIKNSLDNIFAAKHGGIRANWAPPAEVVAKPVQAPVIPLHQKTWVRVAAVAVLLLGTVPFWNLADRAMEEQQTPFIAKLEKPATDENASNTGSSMEEPVKSKAETPSAEVSVDEPAADLPVLMPQKFVAGAVSATNDEIASYELKDAEAEAVDDMQAISYLAGYTAAPTASSGLTTAGIDADLNPNDKYINVETIAISMADQPEDIFDFIVPAF